jgi:hypothetical protein
MNRMTLILIVLAASSGAISDPARAQSFLTESAPGAPGLAGSSEPNPLPGLPRPPDQPKTLYQPAPAGVPYGCPDLECPYFERDPWVDACCMPQPGWLFDLDTDLLGTHVLNQVGNATPPINGVPNVPMARLNWALSPKFEGGYRLPSGFGEFDVSYRFLLTEGVGAVAAGGSASPDAAAALSSHLDMNIGDVDYASVEFPVVVCLMKWRIGLRTADVLFTSEGDEPFAAAAAGSGFFKRYEENNFWGIGPHAAVELTSERNPWGMALVGKLDGALLGGKTHQKFIQTATAGAAFNTETDFENWQQATTLSGFVGLDWRPSSHPNLDVVVGATAEYWWDLGLMSSDPAAYNNPAAAELGAYGAMLRLQYNY